MVITQTKPLRQKDSSMKKHIIIPTIIMILFLLTACSYNNGRYGVFLSVEGELDRFSGYETVVIDAQYFDRETIEDFKAKGHRVFTYLNVGSVENFRDYYSEYEDLTLDVYEHWEDERWVDVSESRWQDFILEELAPALLTKGIDGFFVDNCDVYYLYPTEEILEGLGTIMKGLRASGKEVIANGGNDFVEAYTEKYGDPGDVITGINQESVFSAIDWEGGKFKTATAEDRSYFTEYLEKYADRGVDIYLLEYTTDPLLVMRIKSYCKKHGFYYYISWSLELS